MQFDPTIKTMRCALGPLLVTLECHGFDVALTISEETYGLDPNKRVQVFMRALQLARFIEDLKALVETLEEEV